MVNRTLFYRVDDTPEMISEQEGVPQKVTSGAFEIEHPFEPPRIEAYSLPRHCELSLSRPPVGGFRKAGELEGR